MHPYAYYPRPAAEREAFRRYAELCESEPRLAQLLLETMRVQPTTPEFYRSFKPRLQRLAGFGAEERALHNSEAYDTVYEVIYSWVDDLQNGRSV